MEKSYNAPVNAWQRQPVWIRWGLIPLRIVGAIGGGVWWTMVPAGTDATKTADPAKPGAPAAGAAGRTPGSGRFGGFDPGTSKTAPGHKIYPYLLRHLAITAANQVWALDTRPTSRCNMALFTSPRSWM